MEEQGYLWLIAKDGAPFRVRCFEQLDSYSDLNWQRLEAATPLRSISALRHAAYAVDENGSACLLVTPSHIARRSRCEAYHNQRWYPVLGWSKTLPTERSTYSDENGYGSCPPTSFSLRSAGWRWEEPWTIDLDPRRFDKEGWEYSSNFNLTRWSNVCGRGHFVRRKRISRTQRYVAIDAWIELSSNVSIGFLDITAGCSADDQCYLYALGDDGKIYSRTNVSQENPEGDEWAALPMTGIIQNEHITSISCSPSSGVLLALNWNGQIYAKSPKVDEWLSVPSPHNLPSTSAAIGSSSLWIVTSDSRVFMSELLSPMRLSGSTSALSHQFSLADPDSYIEIGSKVSRLSINAHDQLIGLSMSDGALYARMGVCRQEKAGKTFERIVERFENDALKAAAGSWIAISSSGCLLKEIPKYWVMEHICIFDEEFRSAQWRKQILSLLSEMNEKNWSSLREMQSNANAGDGIVAGDEIDAHHDGITSSGIQIDLNGNEKYKRGRVMITNDVIRFCLDSGMQEQVAVNTLLSVYSSFQYSPQRTSLTLSFVSHNLNKTVLVFTEENEAEKFQLLLEKIIRNSLISSSRNSKQAAMWSVAEDGHVRHHFLSQLETKPNGEVQSVPLDRVRSLSIPGLMQSIAAGCDRIIWTVASDGRMWTMDPLFDSLAIEDCDSSRLQTVTRTLVLEEYQKSAFFRGFISFEGRSKGFAAWMIDGKAVPPKCPKLPSRHWSWVSEEWTIDYSNADMEGWTYADDISGTYSVVGKDEMYGKYARRRRWVRNAEYRCSATPWIRVDGPKVSSIDVQKQSSERIFVAALTCDGNVLLRQGVIPNDPAGTAWKHLVCDFALSSVSILSPLIICSQTVVDNRLLVRKCTEQTDMECVDWERIYVDKAVAVEPLPVTVGIAVLYVWQHDTLLRINPKTDYCTVSPIHEICPRQFVSDSLYRLYVLCDDEIIKFIRAKEIPIVKGRSSYRKRSKKMSLEDLYQVERSSLPLLNNISIV